MRRGKTRTLGSIMKITDAVISGLKALGFRFPKARSATKPKTWRPKERITFDDHGLIILDLSHGSTEQHGARWADIAEVTAGLISVMYGDIVHLDVQLRDGTHFRIDEEMEGWVEFAKALPNHLSGCEPYPQWEMRLEFWHRGSGEQEIVIFGNAA